MDTWYNKYAVMVLASLNGYGGYEWISWADLDASDWAAWVQAIGSIVAIVAGVLITQYQYRKNAQAVDEEKALEALRQLKALRTLVVAAATLVAKASEAFHSGNRSTFDHYFQVLYGVGDLKDIADHIEQLQFQALAGDIHGVLFLKRILVRVDEYLSHFSRGDFTDEQYRNMIERLEKDDRYIKNLIRDIDEAMLREGRRVGDRARVRTAMNIGPDLKSHKR